MDKNNKTIFFICLSMLLISCHVSRVKVKAKTNSTPINETEIKSRVVIKKKVPAVTIDTKNIQPDQIVAFAKTLIGVPYKYGSTKKENGLDCSGFIWYVFNHFNIKVPRISYEYTNAGSEVSLKESRKGDIILFTGSDANSGVVGHLGMIVENSNGKITFIHSASGGNKGVMESHLITYFRLRFVKVNRIFN
jgi:cell wall-associated NlpC family hydrolase